MKGLVFTCPKTGKDVYSGLGALTPKQLETFDIGSGEVRCPHCKQVHTYTKKDLRVGDTGLPDDDDYEEFG
jgi:hypothetical protein